MGNKSSANYKMIDVGEEEMHEHLVAVEEEEKKARLDEAFFYSRDVGSNEGLEKINTKEQHHLIEDAKTSKFSSKQQSNSATTSHPQEEAATSSEHSNFDPFCKLKRLDGWTVVIHTLSIEDTLAGLSLKYEVSTDDIRRANFMTDDRLTSFTRLIIPPKGSKPVFQDIADMGLIENEDQNNVVTTPQHRKRLVQLLTQMDSSNIGDRGAEYYLSRNGYNLRAALNEADADAAFEKKTLSRPNEIKWSPNFGSPVYSEGSGLLSDEEKICI
jgi:hypothetical protein